MKSFLSGGVKEYQEHKQAIEEKLQICSIFGRHQETTSLEISI